MRKIIFGLMVLACAGSGFAAETPVEQPGVDQKPLKFRVNQETGDIEDAPGSDLFQKFDNAVKDVNALYERLKQEVGGQVEKADAALKDMPQGSIERFGTEIHRKKLEKKFNDLEKQRAALVDIVVPLLQETLKGIYNALPSHYFCDSSFSFGCAVPDYEALIKQPLKDFVVDFSSACGPWPYRAGKDTEEENAKKDFIFLRIKGDIALDKRDNLTAYFGYFDFVWKLRRLQRKTFESGALMYAVATHTTDQLNLKQRLKLDPVLRLAERENKNALEILQEQIDVSIAKAETIMPSLAPGYYMAKAIMAFQEEASRHRPQKAEVPATGGSS